MGQNLDDDSIERIVSVYADRGYDDKRIREYLKSRNIRDCIPHRNFKTKKQQGKLGQIQQDQIYGGEVLCIAQGGFHRVSVRYERIAENYLAFLNIASIMMYWRVLV